MRAYTSMHPAAAAALLLCWAAIAVPNSWAGLGDCGQPVTGGDKPAASDALSILSTAVGSVECETCVCDADGSGAVTASDALLVLNAAVGLGGELACESCGEESIVLDSGNIDSAAFVSIAAAAGGSIELAGAVLDIPPGALSEDAQIGLAALPLESYEVADGDGAFGGQVPLSDNAYLIIADRDIVLFQPLTLTVPFEPAAVPVAVGAESLRVAAMLNGYLVPQGRPAVSDLVGGTIGFEIDAPELLKGAATQASSLPALGAGLPFPQVASAMLSDLPSSSVAGLGAGLIPALHWQTFLATVDDLNGLVSAGPAWLAIETAHFRIRFREGFVEFGDASRVGVALENAWSLLVDESGFVLPNALDLDGRYTVYLDDFDEHAAIVETEEGRVPDGFTLPGSGLVEGASYVNVNIPAAQWPAVAVHEYFHALQYGALRAGFASRNLRRAFNDRSSWLFEGATSAVVGRVVAGVGEPHRNDFVREELPQRRSVWSLEDDDPQDVAQEFFLFLEKSFGNTSFYRSIFERLAADIASPLSDTARTVDAVDRGLDDLGAGDSLTAAWSEFVYDRAIGEPNLYNATPGLLKADEIAALTADGAVVNRLKQMPPLSYYLFKFLVPMVDAGDPGADLRRDVEIRLKAVGRTFDLLQVWFSSIPGAPGLPQQGVFVEENQDLVIRFEDFRDANAKQLLLVVGNPSTGEGDDIALDFAGSLVE